LGLVHVVSMSLVTPNMGRRRTPSHQDRTKMTRARRGTGDPAPLPRGLRQSLGSLHESEHDDPEHTTLIPSQTSEISDQSNSTSSTSSESNDETTGPKLLGEKIRPRNASTGSSNPFHFDQNPNENTPKPHHSRKQGTNSLPVWTGTIEEDNNLEKENTTETEV